MDHSTTSTFKITSEKQPCRKCGECLVRKFHKGPPKPKKLGSYYYEWWFACTNRKCRTIYMVDEAKRWAEPGTDIRAVVEAETPAVEECAKCQIPMVQEPYPQNPDKQDWLRCPKCKRNRVLKLRAKIEARKIARATGRAKPKSLPRRPLKTTSNRARKQRRGCYQDYLDYLESPEWATVRARVFAQRGRTCEICGSKDNGIRNVHHLHYRNLFHEEMEDLQVLCAICHRLVHNKEPDASSREFLAWFAASLRREDAA